MNSIIGLQSPLFWYPMFHYCAQLMINRFNEQTTKGKVAYSFLLHKDLGQSSETS